MPPPRRPHVALIIESSINYGRGLLRGIARYLRLHGPWSIFLEQREQYAALPPWLHRWRGDGIITRSDDPRVLALRLPTVGLYDRVAEDRGLPMIVVDNREIGRVAARHLVERGFPRLAYFGVRGEHWSEERLAGVLEVARAAGAGAVEVHPAGKGWERAQERLGRFLGALPKPVGLVACNDIHGLRALDACRRAGVVVPEEVAVVGADDDAELCELSDPPLTSVAFNPERVGYEAAALLDRMMRGARPPRPPMLVPPLGVVPRQSTEPLAIDDPHVARALNFVRRHACDGIDVGAVLAEVPLSRRALEHRFRKRLGRSIKAEIRRLQLDRIKRLLAETDLPIAAISDQLGFHQPAYLSAVFKASTGQSPHSYRRQMRRPGAGVE